MVLIRADLLVLAIILIGVGVFLIAALAPVPYPLVYVGWVVFIAGIFVLAYWIYKQAKGG
jgi:hypothetical protein